MPKARKRRAGRQFQLRKLKALYYKGSSGVRRSVTRDSDNSVGVSDKGVDNSAAHSEIEQSCKSTPRIIGNEPFPYKVYLIKGAPLELWREIDAVRWPADDDTKDPRKESAYYNPACAIDQDAKTPPRAVTPELITLE